MADPAPQVLLDLTSLSTRRAVTIDGISYDLRNPGELTVLEDHRLRRQHQRLYELLDRDPDTMTDEEAAQLSALPDRICRQILVAPDPVQQQLRDGQRAEIMRVFWPRPTESKPTSAATAAGPTEPVAPTAPDASTGAR